VSTNEPLDRPATAPGSTDDVSGVAEPPPPDTLDRPPVAPGSTPDVSGTTVPPPPDPDAGATTVSPSAGPAAVASRPQALEGTPSTGPLRVLSIIVMVAGVILMVAGVVTWFIVRDQLAEQKIVVSDDAPFLGGQDVNGPFTAYAEAEAINDHALEASGGLTYAQLEQDDPTRDTVMTASFLRASLFTSVVSFGVAFFAFGLGIILLLVGWALLRVDRVLRAVRGAALEP